MKFLCIACDQAMRLTDTAGRDADSLTVTFACPACGHRVAMLTNPWETQLVRTLGVKVGGPPAAAPEPFAAVRAGLARQRESALAPDAGRTEAAAAAPPAAGDGPGCPFAALLGDAPGGAAVAWTPAAEARLERIPVFVRPMARQAIERFARERGLESVTTEVLDQARDVMGM